MNIGGIEKSVGSGFARCHRSYIVNLAHIRRITKTEVVMENGKAVPLSRRLYTAVNRAFIDYHTGVGRLESEPRDLERFAHIIGAENNGAAQLNQADSPPNSGTGNTGSAPPEGRK
jgi:hypothetical protein